MNAFMEDECYNLSCVLKLRLPWEGHADKVEKAVHKIEGVRSTEIDCAGNLYVYGDVAFDVGTLMQKLKKFLDPPALDTYNEKSQNGFLKSLFSRKKKRTIVLSGNTTQSFMKSLFEKKKTKTIVLGGNAAGTRSLWSADKQSNCSLRGVEIDRATAMYLPMY